MIETVPQTGSTNADLLARLAADERIEDGYWLRAETQTGGRGRSGRAWLSPPGNLFASTVINLRSGDPAVPTLALAVGLAVHRHVCNSLIQGGSPEVMLKWPNDVLVGQAKIAGILLERSGNAVVAGVGLNIAFSPDVPGRDTTCIKAQNPGYEADAGSALGLLAPIMAEELERWRAEGLSRLIERWQAAAHPPGTRLVVHGPSGDRIAGTYLGLTGDGALIMQDDSGTHRTVHAGDVMLEKG